MSSPQAKQLPSSANFVARVVYLQTTILRQQQQSATNEDVRLRRQSSSGSARRRRGRRRGRTELSMLVPLQEELSLSKITRTKHDETVQATTETGANTRRAQRLFYMPLSVRCLVLLTFQLALVCCQAKQHDPDPTVAEAEVGGEQVLEFVRSRANSARNLELAAKLKSTLAPEDYRLFYPQFANRDNLEQLKDATEGDKGAPASKDASQQQRLSPRQTNLRPSSVVVQSNRFQPQPLDRLQHQSSSSNQATSSATASSSSPSSSSSSASSKLQQSKSNQVLGHYNRTNVVIKAFNYKLRLDLELNNNLFGPALIQKHFLAKGGQQISTQKLEHCYYHASTQAGIKPAAIGAFRTCSGLSGIIHVENESFVIHPLFDADLSKKHPHIIYRYQSGGNRAEAAQQQQQQVVRQCGNARLHQWALRQYNSGADSSNSNASSASATASRQRQRFERNDDLIATTDDCDNNKSCHDKTISSKKPTREKEQEKKKRKKFARDVSLTEKYIELALVLSQDMFDKRNSSTRLEVLHDSIQIINCLDLYFRYSANTRVALIYLETWQHGDQIDLGGSASADVKQILYNFLEYTTRKLYKVSMDAAHLLMGGHARTFDSNEMGMSIPDSICSARAVSVSQEASIFEPFIAASTMAHMLGHNLGMEHDESRSSSGAEPESSQVAAMAFSAGAELSQAPPVSSEDSHQVVTPASNRNRGATSATAKHRSSDSAEQGEEQDDEIKGRSLAAYSHQQQYLEEPTAPADETESGFIEQDQWCQSNCLMSESFTYIQPPVSFGNMVQQQVATASSSSAPSPNGSILSGMFSDNSADLGALPGDTYAPAPNQVATTGGQQLPYRFSRKSIDTYHRLLRMGRGVCLFNKPNQLEDFRTCGNGIVDRGEDCDCGSFQECLENGDTCCDPITCRFKADAECINGACCDRCKLRPKGLVCRRARGECDLPEVCDGKSGQCAPDVHKQNGHPCANQAGFCYLGQCPTHDGQCAELWGQEARKSHRYCYSTFNSNGTIRGNCGAQDAAQSGAGGPKKYKRCEQEHVMCGTIQCQMGDMKPATASDTNQTSSSSGQQAAAEFSKKIIHSIDGASHECKTITGPQSASLQVSYVRDGSKCAPNKVCFNQTCQPVERAFRDSFELCPRDERGRQCSGNGICSTAHRCHCDQGWLGHDCSQRLTSSIVIDATGGQPIGVADQVKPSLTLLEPINVTEMPTPNATTSTIQVLVATPAPTTIAPPSPATVATTPAPAPAVSPSTVVLDKKKHDALGAPTLVFILVSIVAAVYVGFALMANCYRRKGFIKPDKVLRHHQMNCKLDALRSSFIARRLADAAMAGSLDQSGSTSLMPGPLQMSAADPASILNPNLFAQAPASAQFAMQEAAPMQPPYEDARGPQARGFLPSAFRRYPFSGLRNSQLLDAHKQPLQTAAQVHYYDGDQQQQMPQSFAYQQQQQQQVYPLDPTGSGDHIPLLMPSTSTAGHHHQQQPQMRSFKRPTQPMNYPAGNRSYQPIVSRGRSVSRQASRGSEAANINRATSLGNVNGRHLESNKWNNNIDFGDSDDGRDTGGFGNRSQGRYAQKALATPVRRRSGAYRQAPHPPPPPPPPPLVDADSFSAVSSPEPGFGPVVNGDWPGDELMMRAPARQRPAAGYHEDLLLGALAGGRRNADADSADELPLTLPPPPPSKSSSSRHIAAAGQQATDLITTTEDDESTELSTVIQRQAKRQSEPELAKKQQQQPNPMWLRGQRIEKIPLNNMGQDQQIEGSDDDDDDDELEVGDEQLSLLAQLQQLEQVQSLHQRQVANHKPANENAGTLHEFFSLPLSVQLSALLARSLNGPANKSAWQTAPIEEYLNTLNSSNVANMSRRSFKGQNKQQQPGGSGGSRGGTLNRQQQQMKLHNLQSLINRLQKLHQHQQRQQHQLDTDDYPTGSVCEQTPHSRQSTLSRRSGASRNSRPSQTTADDTATTTTMANRSRRTPRRTILANRRSPDNRQESVFSMSDSEDGAPTYATRQARARQQHQQLARKLPDEPNQTPSASSEGKSTSDSNACQPNASSEVKQQDDDNKLSNEMTEEEKANE